MSIPTTTRRLPDVTPTAGAEVHVIPANPHLFGAYMSTAIMLASAAGFAAYALAGWPAPAYPLAVFLLAAAVCVRQWRRHNRFASATDPFYF